MRAFWGEPELCPRVRRMPRFGGSWRREGREGRSVVSADVRNARKSVWKLLTRLTLAHAGLGSIAPLKDDKLAMARLNQVN